MIFRRLSLLAPVLIGGLLAGCSGGSESPVEGKSAGAEVSSLSGVATMAGTASEDIAAEQKAPVSEELTPEESAMVKRAEEEAKNAFNPATLEKPAH